MSEPRDRVLPSPRLDDELVPPLEAAADAWFLDVHSGTRLMLQGVRGVIAHRRTRFQELHLLDTTDLGRCMVLDGRIQVAEVDEFVYHEMLVHPALAFRPAATRALVLGGGDGCTLRELCRWSTLVDVELVDIDGEVVELMREHCGDWAAGAWDDPRVRVGIGDAADRVRALAEPPDLILGDLTEPFDDTGLAGELSSGLFSEAFLEEIRGGLAPGGVLALQTGGVRLDPALDRHHVELVQRVRAVFSHVRVAYAWVPSFGELWSVALGSTRPLGPLEDADVDRVLREAGVEALRFYDGQAHRRLLSAPRHVRRLVGA